MDINIDSDIDIYPPHMSSNKSRIEDLKRKVIKINSVSPTFCIAKWKQSTTTLYNGMTHSCHHPVQHKIKIEDLDKSPTSLHNTATKIAARADMLNGVQTKECDYCWNIENLDGQHFSDRHYKSANEGMGLWQAFDEVIESGLGETINPTYMEVAFENICNFKCSYCSPDVSSRWMEEIQSHGPYRLADGSKQHQLDWLKNTGRFPIHHSEDNPYINKFWEWWPSLYESLNTFRITGGEPLLSDNTWKILDYIIENPRPDFRLNINTNMNLPRKIIERLCDKVNLLHGKIRQVTIYTSAESVGEQAEYSRYGMDWELFTSNIDYFLSNTPENNQIFFMTTVNVLSSSTFDKFLFYIADLRKKYRNNKEHNKAGFNIAYLRWPVHQCITNLDDEEKKQFEQRMLKCIEELRPDEDSVSALYIEEVDQIHRLIKFMYSEKPDPKQQANFAAFFDEYDQRRGTDLLMTFPELATMYWDGKNYQSSIIT